MSSDSSKNTGGRSIISASSEGASEVFGDFLGAFRSKLDGELAAWLVDKQASVSSQSVAADELTGVLEEFLFRGGKRIRPALLYYAFRGCGGESEARVMPMAMAVELLHTYLLVHDDIMDHAETRRGRPAAHVVYRQLHSEKKWAGDEDHFGKSTAILLGDLAQAYSMELYSSVEGLSEDFHRCFAVMCQEVILGQYLEMTAGYRRDLSERELLRVLQMKSGRYSVQRPIELGAILAGASEGTRGALARYGHLIGEAFQLQDDLLGMFGDAETTGKPVGGDLAEGKFTVLVHHALARLAGEDRRFLDQALGSPDLTVLEIDRAQRLIESSGARDRVMQMVEDRMREAEAVLDGLDLRPDGAEFLRGLIGYLRGREQ